MYKSILMRFYQNGLNCLGYPKCDMLSPQADEIQQKNTQNTKKATLSREESFCANTVN
jgi:hypothetical protein